MIFQQALRKQHMLQVCFFPKKFWQHFKKQIYYVDTNLQLKLFSTSVAYHEAKGYCWPIMISVFTLWNCTWGPIKTGKLPWPFTRVPFPPFRLVMALAGGPPEQTPTLWWQREGWNKVETFDGLLSLRLVLPINLMHSLSHSLSLSLTHSINLSERISLSCKCQPLKCCIWTGPFKHRFYCLTLLGSTSKSRVLPTAIHMFSALISFPFPLVHDLKKPTLYSASSVFSASGIQSDHQRIWKTKGINHH